MTDNGWSVVTGANGYSGRAITQQLLSLGRRVKSLTRRTAHRSPFGDRVPMLPYRFDDIEALTDSLRGAEVLYNTYWIRFEYDGATFAQTIGRIRQLLQAAKAAGVKRVVHLSVTNPTASSHLPYYRGKAIVEEAIRSSGLSYAIIRPTVMYGHDDILINNIAWCLRRFPLFLIPGTGAYRLQPIFVEDVARMAVELARERDNLIVDAAGPDMFAFSELVRALARAVGSRTQMVHAPPAVACAALRVIGGLVRDVILTRDELAGLMGGLLISTSPPRGRTRFTAWLSQHAGHIGRAYASELQRNWRFA